MLLGSVYLLLNLPSVQNSIKNAILTDLRSRLNTDLDIKSLHITPFTNVQLNDVYIKDRRGDTALVAKKIYAGIDLLPLLRKHVVVTSVALSDFQVRLSKENKKAPLNIQFIIDAFASKKKKEPSPYDVKINFVNLKEGRFRYDVFDQNYNQSKIDFNHIYVHDLSAKLSLKSLKSDSMNINVKQLALTEKSGFNIVNLTARLLSSKNHWDVKGFEVDMPSSQINFGKFSFDIQKGENLLEKISLHCHLKPSTITLKDISAFVPALKNFKDVLQLETVVWGKVNDIHLQNLKLAYGEKMVLDIDASLRDALVKDKLFVHGKVRKLDINKAGIEGLSSNLSANKVNVPNFVNNMGRMSFVGEISGYLSRLKTIGAFDTDLGKVKTEVLLGINAGKSTFLDGKVTTSGFYIGQLLGNKDLNQVSLELNIKLDKREKLPVDIVANGTIFNIDYKGYNYKNVKLDGSFIGKKIDGILSLADPNIQLDVRGQADLASKVPVFNLAMNAGHLQLDKLNLYGKETSVSLAFSAKANFKGNSIDNAIGALNIDSVYFKKSNAAFFLHQFSIESGLEENSKHLIIRSDILNGDVRGSYLFSTLVRSIKNTLALYMPTLFTSDKSAKNQTNNFNFNFILGNTEKLSAILNLPVINYSDAKLMGYYDNIKDRLRVEGFIPSLFAAGQRIQSGYFMLENQEKSKLNAKVNGIVFSNKGIANDVGLDVWASNDSIHSNLSFDSQNKQKFKGTLATVTSFRRSGNNNALESNIQIIPGNLILNDSIWNVKESGIKIASGAVSFDNFILQNQSGNQYLKLDGAYSGKDPDKKLYADLHHIDLTYVFQMLKIKALNFGGQASGQVIASSTQGKPYYTCNLSVDGFLFNQAYLGKLQLYSELEKQTNRVILKGDITNDNGDKTLVDGFINPVSRELSVSFDAHHVNIGFVHGYVSTLFNKVEGTGSGKVRLFGDLSNVTVEGDAAIEKGVIGVDMLNTTYSFTDTIHLKKDLIYFNDVRFHDEAGNSALCSGKISHSFFNDINYNITLDSHNFLVYNGTEKQNPSFSGRIYASGNGSITGDEQAVHLNMQIKTEANSFLRLNFMNETATEYSFIKYKKPEIILTDNSKPKPTQNQSSGMAVYMNFYINATPDATVELVMDPVGGDVVRGNGSGNIQFEWDLKSEPKIYGNYVINKGTYNFTFQKIMEKRFSINDGSSVQFRGDPYAANLDIKALYRVTANLNDLSQSLAQTSGQTNVPVNCLMNISGELRHPNIGLDLELPSADPEIQRQVKNLINTEDMMNRQIVYLLLLSRFYTPDENMADNPNRSTNFASLASATLSSNLSNILSQIDKRWQVGTNIRTSNSEFTNTEVELLLSSQLLNDRLLVNGNFGYRDNLMVQNAFVSEVDVEMLLNKSGNLRLKAYNHLNEKYYYYSSPGSPVQTQGIGLLYKRDFNNIRELFPQRKNTDRDTIHQDTLRPVVPDSAKKGSSISQFVKIKK